MIMPGEGTIIVKKDRTAGTAYTGNYSMRGQETKKYSQGPKLIGFRTRFRLVEENRD